MARVARLAGALLAETGGQYFLVGNTREPCDFAAAGFTPPASIDALERPYLRLEVAGAVRLAPPWLHLEIEGEPLAALLAERLVIARTGSVSERLWRLVVGERDEETAGAAGMAAPAGLAGAAMPAAPAGLAGADQVPARWLAEVPWSIWNIVRDTVLRCS
jgi:hypothetical protein